jgi:hypothetical protein
MDTNDIRSQIEKAKLPAFGADMSVVPEVVVGNEVAQSMESESLIRKKIPLAPTEESLKKADADIRKGVEKGIRKEMIPLIASQEAGRGVRQGTGESGQREIERMEAATTPISPLSTRQAQQQVPKRVDQRGKAVQRPRLTEGRQPASTTQSTKKGMSKALKWALIAGGSTGLATGGILGLTNLLT